VPPARREQLSLGEAIALGAVQGPTELLPVSSSAHTTLLAGLAGSPYVELPGNARKEFEVALHAGAGLALALDMRRELLTDMAGLDGSKAATMALSTLPAALVGYALEGAIERRLGGAGAIAAGLAAGAVAMALADGRPGALCGRRPRRPGSRSSRASRASVLARARGPQKRKQPRGDAERERRDAGPRDGLALGIAQALALAPGISRSGATLTAARARGFGRADATALSWHAGLPVLLGASALKGWRLRERVRREALGQGTSDTTEESVRGGALLAGGLSAFGSTLLSARAARRMRIGERPLLGFAVYRCLLAWLVARRGRGERRARRGGQ
jgi:undecaprenyl-diphosphatase